jgi:cobalt/nickel transport system ATP-binding protein
MSGGEKRMAALAGILVLEPRVILLDEPTSSLDPKARRDTAEVLEKLGTPMIISTHDLLLAKHVCEKAIIMQDGRIRAEGPPPEILESAEKLRRYGL